MDLEKVYGVTDEVSVFTGTIMDVGDKYFLHDIDIVLGARPITFVW